MEDDDAYDREIGRALATAFRIVLVSSSLSQILEEKIKENDITTISFVYGDEPIGCLLHQNCPMRFQSEDMRLKHYRESRGLQITLYQCRSCLRSNRRMLFPTKDELIRHKRNPRLQCNNEQSIHNDRAAAS